MFNKGYGFEVGQWISCVINWRRFLVLIDRKFLASLINERIMKQYNVS